MSYRLRPIIAWEQCNTPIRAIIGKYHFYSDTPPTGCEWLYDNRLNEQITSGPLYESEVRRREDLALSDRERLRYP